VREEFGVKEALLERALCNGEYDEQDERKAEALDKTQSQDGTLPLRIAEGKAQQGVERGRRLLPQ